jgi:hypothetical protein
MLHIIVVPDKPVEINVEIISPIGQKIHRSRTSTDSILEEIVDVSSYSSGIYLVRVSTAKGQLVLKVVVQ